MLIYSFKNCWNQWSKTCFFIVCYLRQTSMAEEISAETEMTPRLFEAILMLDGIIPAVLQHPPKYVLNVTYPPKLEIEFGTELLPSDLKVPPKIRDWYTEKGLYYVLVMTGMDEPYCKHPTQAQYLYWFVGNIPGTNISAGYVYAPYLPPRPKKDTEAHRYVFVLYQQPKRLEFRQPTLSKDYDDARRTGFSTLKLWTDYELTPWAANSFESAYNETVRQAS